MIVRILGAFIAVVSFSGLVGVPSRYLFYAGTTGAVGWGVYMAGMEWFGLTTVMATFVSVLVIALMSHIYARICRAPVTVFLIAGILPLVPGAGMYRIAFYIMSGDNAMTAYYGRETLQIAGMIALAIFIMDSLFKLMQRKK